MLKKSYESDLSPHKRQWEILPVSEIIVKADVENHKNWRITKRQMGF